MTKEDIKNKEQNDKECNDKQIIFSWTPEVIKNALTEQDIEFGKE